jgi:hypothetical protein
MAGPKRIKLGAKGLATRVSDLLAEDQSGIGRAPKVTMANYPSRALVPVVARIAGGDVDFALAAELSVGAVGRFDDFIVIEMPGGGADIGIAGQLGR